MFYFFAENCSFKAGKICKKNMKWKRELPICILFIILYAFQGLTFGLNRTIMAWF